MIAHLSFRAQALDNMSPAHLQIGDRLVPEQAAGERRRAAEEITAISERGRVVWERGGAKLTRHGSAIMLKVHGNERDERGRFAPILCWGTDGGDQGEFRTAAFDGLQMFAGRIGRTINPDHLALLQHAFDDGKKKRSNKWLIPVLAVIAAVGAIGYAVVTQGSSPRGEPNAQASTDQNGK